MDQRNYVMYSGLAVWTGGYHKNREFRYYKHGQFTGSCWEDNAGNNASTHFLFPHYNWQVQAPLMYKENVQAALSNSTYQAVTKANDALKIFQGYFGKAGNNGTVSCETFCAGSQWDGGTGRCVGAILREENYPLSCSAVPGLLTNGAHLICQCVP
jgi:hypothetical protein